MSHGHSVLSLPFLQIFFFCVTGGSNKDLEHARQVLYH
jgi:hypothetical protein